MRVSEDIRANILDHWGLYYVYIRNKNGYKEKWESAEDHLSQMYLRTQKLSNILDGRANLTSS